MPTYDYQTFVTRLGAAMTDISAAGLVTWEDTPKYPSGLMGTFSVKDFGAVGDGSTDDTTAVRAAMTAAGSFTLSPPISGLATVGGGTVFFPAGVYRITDTLSYLSGTHFMGVGWGSEILFQPGASKALFSPSTTTADGRGSLNTRWSQLMMWGWSANSATGIVIGPSHFATLEDVVIAHFNEFGVKFLTPVAPTGNYYHRLTGCYLYNNGVNLEVQASANAVTVIGGEIRHVYNALGYDGNPIATPDYLITLAAINTTFCGTAIEGSANLGLIYDEGVGTTLTGCYTESLAPAYAPLVVSDAAVKELGGLTLSGITSTGTIVKYENWDRIKETSPYGLSFPDHLGLGTPQYLYLVANPSFADTLTGWFEQAAHATLTKDTTKVFNSRASLKFVHSGDGGTEWIDQALDVTPYLGQPLYLTAMVYWTTEYPELYIETDSRNRFLTPIIDFGNGWQMWAASFNASIATSNLSIRQTSSVASTTCYVTNVQAWIGGMPQIPIEMPEPGADDSATAAGYRELMIPNA
jgi:hypothetical protein